MAGWRDWRSTCRRRVKNTADLSEIAKAFLVGDERCYSYRLKLQLAQSIVCAPGAGTREWAAAALYLHWVGSGAVACAEDGELCRPSHHAGAARAMYDVLEPAWEAALALGDDGALLAIRRLSTKLPCFTEEFARSQPLTRIRDIAQGKGDQQRRCRAERMEIARTIQEKLHRCAGPEDLVTTEKMLKRLTAPGSDYPEEFVAEFRAFHAELKAFFNVSSADERLSRLPGLAQQGRARKAVDAWRAAGELAAPADAPLPALLSALRKLNRLRSELSAGAAAAGSLRTPQRAVWHSAEISLESTAFVLLSRIASSIESGAAEDSLGPRVLLAACDALAVSGAFHEDCAEILRHLRRIESGEGGDSHLLQTEAAARQARRLSEQVADAIDRVYGEVSRDLGRAFALPEKMVAVDAVEGEVRASIAFQLSRVASAVLVRAKKGLGRSVLDSLVVGDGVGCVKVVADLETWSGAVDNDGKSVLLVEYADGDEDIGPFREGIAAVILLKELPHLSHLALRMRQARIPLATCTDPVEASRLCDLAGRRALASVTPEEVVVEAAETGGAPGPPSPEEQAKMVVGPLPLPITHKYAGRLLRPLQLQERSFKELLVACGAKAAGCASLAFLAQSYDCGFKVPTSFCLPFGTLEMAIAEAQLLVQHKDALQRAAREAIGSTGLREVASQLSDLARTVPLPSLALQDLVDELTKLGVERCIVRSSASSEDLAGCSGAGLYRTLLNVAVRPGATDSLVAAVREVWASLYAERAVASRRAANTSESGTSMAVLVQPLLAPELSFVLHTSNPLNPKHDALYMEIVPGLGETLARGLPGTPWRMLVERESNFVKTLAVCDFQVGLHADPLRPGKLMRKKASILDHPLSLDEGYRQALARRLAAVGWRIEREIGGGRPQDIEGCLVDGEVYVVQARPQSGAVH